MGGVLPREFYERDPSLVAQGLLGARLVRRLAGAELECVIVETEAYYGPSDPASRASMHRGGRIVERLRGPVGVALVYGIHGQWMLNIVAHEPGGWGAVLLRGCAPGRGLGDARLDGPGRLTRALRVDRSLDGVPVYLEDSPLSIHGPPGPPEGARVARGWRVGVRRDLPVPLRFCLEGWPGVSRPCRTA